MLRIGWHGAHADVEVTRVRVGLQLTRMRCRSRVKNRESRQIGCSHFADPKTSQDTKSHYGKRNYRSGRWTHLMPCRFTSNLVGSQSKLWLGRRLPQLALRVALPKRCRETL